MASSSSMDRDMAGGSAVGRAPDQPRWCVCIPGASAIGRHGGVAVYTRGRGGRAGGGAQIWRLEAVREDDSGAASGRRAVRAPLATGSARGLSLSCAGNSVTNGQAS